MKSFLLIVLFSALYPFEIHSQQLITKNIVSINPVTGYIRTIYNVDAKVSGSSQEVVGKYLIRNFKFGCIKLPSNIFKKYRSI